MPRRAENSFSLFKGRVRASMNKYNVFNLYKKPDVRYNGKSLYQQKWYAKQETRAYHGDHLTEGRWMQLFQKKADSVAQLDASLKGTREEPTPYSLQTYAALEKRLEFAVFRAMFASSVRQAREFIRSGHVKVNGTVVRHPSFPLQSGDLFSVTPEKVLMAMGRAKPSLDKAIKTDVAQVVAWNRFVANVKENPHAMWELAQAKPKALNSAKSSTEEDRKASIRSFNENVEKQMLQDQKAVTRESVLSSILKAASTETEEEAIMKALELKGKKYASKYIDVYTKLMAVGHPLLKANSIEDCKKYISTKSNEFENESEVKLAASIKKILNELVSDKTEQIRISANSSKLSESSKFIPFTSDYGKNLQFHQKLDKEAIAEDESTAKVNLPWQKGLFGRQDPSKPYFTPWTPRPFIGVFAVLPHHIEVSFETCHAVYLQDPVARPGHSEVISPLPESLYQRAYMYYGRKGM